jgi:hypothetical protein
MAELQPMGTGGTGLPTLERNVLAIALKATAWFKSDRALLHSFKTETEALAEIFENDESYDVFHPLLIPRVVGIEDSSRHWSIAMILQHLCLVNMELTIAVEALNQGIVPRGEVDVSLYKPDADVGVNVLDQFRQVNAGYVSVVDQILSATGQLSRSPAYRHPWFGLLNAHQWHALVAMHQTVHRRQAQKIVAMLGVT